MIEQSTAFVGMIRHPVRSRLFLLLRLPSAFFSGVRIRSIDPKTCAVSVPYSWFSANPFGSTYFACLAMAAEMSTGALALSYIHQRKPVVSMLVVKMESRFFKKARGRTIFLCEEGARLRDCIENAWLTREPGTVSIRSVGTNAQGETVAEFLFTWSFKAKPPEA